MSCGQPSSEEVESENIPILPPPSTSCVRCGQPPKIVVRATTWCHDCFLASFQGRFRKNLEGAKLVSRNGFKHYTGGGDRAGGGGKKIGNHRHDQELSNVVLAFSGGSSSRAMLELFKTSYFKQPEPEPEPEEQSIPAVEPEEAEEQGQGEEEEKKKPKKQQKKKAQIFPPAFKQCFVVFIDESELPGFGPDKTEEIRQIVETTTPFKFVPLKLSSIFTSASSSTSSLLSTSISSSTLSSHASTSSSSSSTTPLEKLLSLLHPTPPLPPTTYSTLHQTLLNTLLVSTTLSIPNCDVLLTGENSTRIGIKTISNMSQGRGWSLGEEISIEYIHQTSKEGGESLLLICKPMGSSLAKEVGYFVKSENLDIVTITNEDTSLITTSLQGDNSSVGPAKIEKDIKKIGIGKLVEDFVLNLEAQFPSTVSIITKTAHKLGMRSADSTVLQRSINNCVLCEMPAQINAEGWNRAITISDLISARQSLVQPALPTTLEERNTLKTATTTTTTTTTTTGGFKKREPYQPSQNHLLSESNVDQDLNTTSSSGTASTTTLNTTHTKEETSEEATTLKESSFDLSNHLCYACLLLLQTSSSSSKKKVNSSSSDKEQDRIELPPYVLENVERKVDNPKLKEVKGQEGLRKEIQEYLI